MPFPDGARRFLGNAAPLSFPQPGWTLALDVPGGHAELGDLLHALDRVVLDAGGRHYLAKEAHTAPAVVRAGYPRLVMFSSLSKRSNVPGMRSGFVAGDAEILKKFLLYRTYQGCAMSPPIHAASTAAWQDEAHVVENRRLYREKFAAVTRILREVIEIGMPDAAFYLWLDTLTDDTAFTRSLLEEQNVSVLPGSYLARAARGVNPGANFVRIALVASTTECTDAAQRIAAFLRQR